MLQPTFPPQPQVTVNVPASVFASNAPTGPFEANTSSPYLGTPIGSQYAPSASNPVDGDQSAAIKTFLADGTEITLSTYVFPLGPTLINHTVTNSAGVTTEEQVTIVVADTIAPVVTVAAPAFLVTLPTGSVIDYSDKVRVPG